MQFNRVFPSQRYSKIKTHIKYKNMQFSSVYPSQHNRKKNINIKNAI